MTFTLDVYGNAAATDTQGAVPLGQITVRTDANGTGQVAGRVPLPSTSLVGGVTATATDAAGNTSEFSAATAVTPFESYLPLVALFGP